MVNTMYLFLTACFVPTFLLLGAEESHDLFADAECDANGDCPSDISLLQLGLAPDSGKADMVTAAANDTAEAPASLAQVDAAATTADARVAATLVGEGAAVLNASATASSTGAEATSARIGATSGTTNLAAALGFAASSSNVAVGESNHAAEALANDASILQEVRGAAAPLMVLVVLLCALAFIVTFLSGDFSDSQEKSNAAAGLRVPSVFSTRGLDISAANKMPAAVPGNSSPFLGLGAPAAGQTLSHGCAHPAPAYGSARPGPASSASLRSANFAPEVSFSPAPAPPATAPRCDSRSGPLVSRTSDVVARDVAYAAESRSTVMSSKTTTVPPPPICPALVMPNTETRFLIKMDDLQRIKVGSLEITGNSGRALLTATISASPPGSQELARLSIASIGCTADPRTTLIVLRPSPGSPSPAHILIGKDEEAYGTFEIGSIPPFRSLLKHQGIPVMHLEMTNMANFSIIAYSMEGATLCTSGPKEQNLNPPTGDSNMMWRMQVKPGADAVLITTCMLAMMVFGAADMRTL
eukprot:TRINITY_DN3330_c0_g1_i2.p1 TRINITY_DN3330_c0_g1~~TRINITY_DN3330_c0_g1_i2.p1  ORF type:complete len:529 (+),score=83.68 TRINITY_DN3330_c0_g1_i2:915-2501(+)